GPEQAQTDHRRCRQHADPCAGEIVILLDFGQERRDRRNGRSKVESNEKDGECRPCRVMENERAQRLPTAARVMPVVSFHNESFFRLDYESSLSCKQTDLLDNLYLYRRLIRACKSAISNYSSPLRRNA